MALRELLAAPYTHGYDHKKGRAQAAQRALQHERAALGAALGNGYLVKASGSAVSLPLLPWVAVLDKDVTMTAKSGLYVVYLYNRTMDRIFLSLNQGVTAHKRARQEDGLGPKAAETAALQDLLVESDDIRAALDPQGLSESLSTIDLTSQGKFLASGYEAGNIAALAYDATNLPGEEALQADLQRFLTLYDAGVLTRSQLTASDPRRYRTPARVKPQVPTERNAVFAPKSSADYAVSHPARVEHRTRRHEEIVARYGQFAQGLGWDPATNRHPRDLVLTRGTDHVLCEVKTVGTNAEFAVREAIGQLFTYRHMLYAASQRPTLLAVFSGPIGEAFTELLDELGILAAWPEGSGWYGTRAAATAGLATTGPQ